MSASNPELALPEPPGCLARLAEWLRSWSGYGRVPEVRFDHAVAALLMHTANLNGTTSPARQMRIKALLRDYLGQDEAVVTALMNAARHEDDSAVDTHHFARVVNRDLSQEARLGVLDMAAQVAFADTAGAEEEGFLRLLGGLLGISDHDRGLVQHRARTGQAASPSTTP
jgi:uncharacterized tellurite resistance protein B-like protein